MTVYIRRTSLGFFLFGFLQLSACIKQGEGERCNGLNGNDDCAEGLICVEIQNQQKPEGNLCCPSDRNASTLPECRTRSVQKINEAIDASSNADSSQGSP